MSELNAPYTPKSDHTMRLSETTPLSSPTKGASRSAARLGSPVRDTGAMTPPPSTQLPKPSAKAAQSKTAGRREHSLASPPATLKASPPITSGGLFGELPSLEAIHTMDEGQLRGLVHELLPAFGEARVNAAHSKLQHSLLSIETEEAAKRAAVEHEATRREVQVLQEGSPANRNSFSPQSPQASMQRNLQLALAHCRDLQNENSVLDKRLRSSKRLIIQLEESNAHLNESVQLLRQRIKENRDHLKEMQSTGAISINGTPSLEYSTPLHNRTPKTPATASRLPRDANTSLGRQDPFDALLLAGQVMNGEASSVPSSPLQARAKKIHPQHMRGAHSLSSLPITPLRSRPATANDALITAIDRADHQVSFSAPGTRLTYHEESCAREDRESTISASDNEVDGDIPGSQASQMATSMLRRSLSSPNEAPTPYNQTPESSKLMQAKLFGNATKPAVTTTKSSKRKVDNARSDDFSRGNKKARTTIKHNQQIQHNHFRKDWQRRVRTHFDQPGRKSRRRNARITKAAAIAPRPVDKLKPIVRCPSIKYNRRVRAGRGFSLVELKEAGIPRKFAATIGISVDPRRANLSDESLTANVARLKAYRERLILFPRKSGQYKKNDATEEEIVAHEKGEQKVVRKTHHTLPIIDQAREEAISEVKKSDMPKGEEAAYRKLRDARSEARLVGVREKRAKAKQDESAAAKK